MHSLSQYLDRIKSLKKLDKDSDLARFLKVSRAHISQLRSGAYMGELKCFELAKILNIEPLEVLSLNRAIRNTNMELSNYWLGVHLKVKGK